MSPCLDPKNVLTGEKAAMSHQILVKTWSRHGQEISLGVTEYSYLSYFTDIFYDVTQFQED
jgi:hypothetical protein